MAVFDERGWTFTAYKRLDWLLNQKINAPEEKNQDE
jgi:hypothetical protein